MRTIVTDSRDGRRRTTVRALLAVVAGMGLALAGASEAAANFPHFRSFSVTTISSGAALTTLRAPAAATADLPDLRYTWTEVGVGSTDVTYEARTVVTATFGCVNNASKQPSAQNKATVTSPVSATVVLTSDRNGRITGSLDLDTATAVPTGFSCPSGQTVTAISATFTQNTITDLVNQVTATADDITVILWP